MNSQKSKTDPLPEGMVRKGGQNTQPSQVTSGPPAPKSESRILSNNPPVMIAVDRETAEFLLENCEANLRMALNILSGGFSRETLEKTVVLTEKFKKLRVAVQAALVK